MSALTKVFIVLQLICSLALSVLIVLMVSKEENYRVNMTNTNAAMLGLRAENVRVQEQASADVAKASADMLAVRNELDRVSKSVADMTAKLADAERSRSAAEQKNSQLTSTNSSLNNTLALQATQLDRQNKELTDLRSQVPTLTKQLADVNRTASDQKTALDAADMAIRKLQERVVTLEAAPRAASTGGAEAASSGLQTSVQINGRVTKIGESAGHSLIELPLGTRDGVQVGTRFMLSRDGAGGGYIADAVVQNVSAGQAVAEVTFAKPGQTVQVGDLATSGR